MMTTRRRDFLSALGVGAIAAVAGTPLSASERSSLQPAPVSDKYDMTWVDRIKGKRRAVFDSPEISEGAACDLAFGQVVYKFRTEDKKVKRTQAEARAMALEYLIPGIILQPSGFFAVLRAQDEGCGFIVGS